MKAAYFFIIVLTIGLSSSLQAQGAFNVKFSQPDKTLRKFLVTQINVDVADQFREKPPYVRSATINLTLNSEGVILKTQFVETSSDKEFNELVEKLVLSTSGLWEVVGIPANKSTVNVIIPFLQKTPPGLKSLRRPELVTAFERYHRSLAISKIPNCEVGSCVIMDEVVNGILPATKGVK